MRIELLVDAPDFWARLKGDLRDATRNAYIQTFSFEGDRVGDGLGRALERCAAEDRRLLVDGYSLLYHNDRLIPGPAWLERPFRQEVLITHRWVRRLRRERVGVKFGNALGPSPFNLVRRNHKKLALIDDHITYLGGINFSEHNFAWHDMMFRIESPELGCVIADDFRASWNGSSATMDRLVGPLRLLSLNGHGNPRGFEPLLHAMRSARKSIDVASAYLSHPFTSRLAAARRKGVRVRVLTPAENNKANLARHIVQTAHRYGFDVFKHSGGMSHLKAMLIDGDLLVAGSSNFDFMSYHILEELLFMTRERAIVEAFVDRVWAPNFARALRVRARPGVGTRLGSATVRVAAEVAAALAQP